MVSNYSGSESGFQIKDSLFGAQMLFVAFGALVLVPLLTGLDPNVALNEFALKGIGLAGITGVVLNLVLPKKQSESSRSEHVRAAEAKAL